MKWMDGEEGGKISRKFWDEVYNIALGEVDWGTTVLNKIGEK